MATLDGIPLETLALWLSEAQPAYHALSTGTQTVSIGTGDTRVTFTAANIADLRQYISELQSAIAVLSGGTGRPKGIYITGGKGL
jgi:hypothetical protein